MRISRTLLAVALVLTWVCLVATAKDFTPEQSAKITQLVGNLLERGHYRQAPLDDFMSGQFLKNYLEALDYNHMIFLQSDVDEFTEKHSKTLDDRTKAGDTKPAYEIFDLYLKRLEERQQLVDRLLEEKFDFSVEETYQPGRNKEPWPKDAAETEKLWRLRIKGELLQDRLAKLTAADKKKEEQAKVVMAEKVVAPDGLPVGEARFETADGKSVKVVPPKDTADSKDAKPDTKPDTEPAKPYDPSEAIKTIHKRYQRLLKNMREFDTEEILGTYLTALSHTYDPHTDYMGPTEVDNFEITNVKLKLTGIGASLRFNDGYTEVVQLIPGGPADVSKLLKPKDRIIAVAQGTNEPVDVIEMKLSKVVSMIRGKPDTQVRLTIIPASSLDGSERKEITFTRAEVKLVELHAKARIIEHTNSAGGLTRLGVLTLPEFYEHAVEDVEKLLKRLKQEEVSGLVLDLRRNGGGLLHAAVGMTGSFIKTGPVVQVKDFRKHTQVLADEETDVAYDGPLIVLVSHMSASASEIVAAALQDYGRALIVGDQTTHGKGTVQQLVSLNQLPHFRDFPQFRDLPNPGKVKLTVSKFYRVAGGTTQKYGVTPDLILPSVLDYMDMGEASLPNALSADQTTPVPFTKVNRIAPALEELRKRSSERVRQSEEFGHVNEDIERFKKQKELKTVSLNEKTRLQEKLDEKKRAEARKQAMVARKKASEKIFELTLQTVEKNEPAPTLAQVRAKENDQLASTAITDPTDDALPEPDPAVDAHLDETLNILGDLIELLEKNQDKPLADTSAPAGR
ncbi:MAG: carboxy terminal-processing peptidase [Verrucomicrobia bacterium]|nr:carboxy terminal-processing peptidase [Verrucomicrobiota bacterium]